MSRIWNGLGLAALLATLLVGTGSAADSEANVTGCILSEEYVIFYPPTSDLELFRITYANLTYGATEKVFVTNDLIGVGANDTWDLTVSDANYGNGYMKTDLGTSLTNKLQINDAAPTVDTWTLVSSGAAACLTNTTFSYKQTLDPSADNVLDNYAIDLTFALSPHVT